MRSTAAVPNWPPPNSRPVIGREATASTVAVGRVMKLTSRTVSSNDAGAAQVGHSDRIGHGNQSWNSSHATTGCSQEDFASWNGAGFGRMRW